MSTTQERFDEKYEAVTESGCWIWTAYTDKDGYGTFHKDGQNIKAHRTSYLLHNGAIPKGIRVCHRCDTPSCVNPQHLFLGTDIDNVRDKVNKNRQAKGSDNGRAILDEQSVKEIRDLLNGTTLLQKEIGLLYNVDQNVISKINRRISWRHL